MTEAQWLAAKHPTTLLESGHCADPRKHGLFGCASARRVLHFLTDPRFERGLRGREAQLDNPGNYVGLRNIASRAQSDLSGREAPERERRAARSVYWACAADPRQAAEEARFAIGVDTFSTHLFAVDNEEILQAEIVRDLFGNPFRPLTFEDRWRTDTVVSLASTMYEAREFSAMPILADALQDAGCDNADILAHCRDTSLTHVRGCWVVDLVLGKK
jgi:hypothetical protein